MSMTLNGPIKYKEVQRYKVSSGKLNRCVNVHWYTKGENSLNDNANLHNQGFISFNLVIFFFRLPSLLT